VSERWVREAERAIKRKRKRDACKCKQGLKLEHKKTFCFLFFCPRTLAIKRKRRDACKCNRDESWSTTKNIFFKKTPEIE
jgi:hypothetical protein